MIILCFFSILCSLPPPLFSFFHQMEGSLLTMSSSSCSSPASGLLHHRRELSTSTPLHKPSFFSLPPSKKPRATSVHAVMTLPGSLTGKKRVDESESLTLEGIRDSLIRQEDSIIYGLLERAKYCYNADTYDPNAFDMEGFNGSLVEYMLKGTEKLHAKVGRYKSPDEHPFFPDDLPEPMLPPLHYPKVLHFGADSININNKIWNMYFRELVPRLVKKVTTDQQLCVMPSAFSLFQRGSITVNLLRRPSSKPHLRLTSLPSKHKIRMR